MHQALLYSRLSYCILVWGTTTSSNYLKLISIQKRALRAIEEFHDRPSDLPTSPLFQKHGILNVKEVYNFYLLKYIHRHQLFFSCPDNSSSRYAFRTKRKLVPITRTNYGKQTLSCQIPPVINRFPFETEYYLPQKRFKSIIKKRLLEQTE